MPEENDIMNKKPWLANAGQGFSCFELLVMILQWI